MATREQQREYERTYRERNREQIRETNRAKYATDPAASTKSRERMKAWRQKNPERARAASARLRKQRRERLDEIKREAGCRDCRITDPRVLDFHHEGDKTLAVSQLIQRRGWDAVLAEIARCIVLCANCHRIVHAEDEVGSDVTAQIAVFFRAS